MSRRSGLTSSTSRSLSFVLVGDAPGLLVDIEDLLRGLGVEGADFLAEGGGEGAGVVLDGASG